MAILVTASAAGWAGVANAHTIADRSAGNPARAVRLADCGYNCDDETWSGTGWMQEGDNSQPSKCTCQKPKPTPTPTHSRPPKPRPPVVPPKPPVVQTTPMLPITGSPIAQMVGLAAAGFTTGAAALGLARRRQRKTQR